MDVKWASKATEELETSLGATVKATRLSQNQLQAEVARTANISVGALQRLEQGAGSSLRTFIQVSRALGHPEWLTVIAPPAPQVSPMQLVRERNRETETVRKRARRSRKS